MSQTNESKPMPIERNEPRGIKEYLQWLESCRKKTYYPVITVDIEDHKRMFPQYYPASGK